MQGPGLSRRDFGRVLGAVAAVAPRAAESGRAAPAPDESAVARFFESLAPRQREALCFPSDHPLRGQVRNNWAVVRPTIGDLTPGQRALCREIFRGLCSEEGHERFHRQMDDDSGGFENYHVALFGEPGGDGPFEWVLTGRHATLRVDGRAPEGAAFGGPIFWGHGAEGEARNVWRHQAERVGRLLEALDAPERRRAVVARAGPGGGDGLDVAALDVERKGMVVGLVDDLLRPFGAGVAASIRARLDESGGVDALRLTCFREGGDARDVWRLAGPRFSWSYHGRPHVHAWLEVGRRA